MTSEYESVLPTKVGPYRVGERLGAGGMGEVYRGYDERLERPVALKHIRAELLTSPLMIERLRREARSLARLNHPAVVQIHDWVEAEDGCWFVMEFVSGQTLKSVLGGRPLAPEKVVALGGAVAAGLAAAHEAGIVHRDLKSANVMISEAGKVKVLDFGLAKNAQPGEEENTLTEVGRILGTASAMSPEQAMGKAVDERSDLFSFGVLLYEMATGKVPFSAGNPIQTLALICSDHQVPAHQQNPQVPESLSELIDHLLEKEASARPLNLQLVIGRLRQIEGELLGEGTLDRRPGAPADLSLEFSTPVDGNPPLGTALEVGRQGGEPGATGGTTGSFARRTSERRQITVLSADVLTPQGTALEAEELYELLPEIEGIALGLARHWEGHFEQSIDHRLVICFGYPTAHEDEARRAVLAALELVELIAHLGREKNRPLAVRIGLHTGLTVVAVDVRGERLMLGQLLDLANEIRGRLEPGYVALSPETYRLVKRSFECIAAGEVKVAGSSDSHAVYRVVAGRDFGTPGQDLELVARREELDLILGRWRRAKAGEGQVLLLSGGVGIGKSRLVRELVGRLTAEGIDPGILYSSPETSSSPLRPILQLMRRTLRLDRAGAPEEGVIRLEKMLHQLGLGLEDHVPFLAPLLSLSPGDQYQAPDLGPRLLQQKIQEAILGIFLATASEEPQVMIVEDLHWLDPSSLALVELLLDEVASVPLLVVLTCRPEFEVPWRQHSHLTWITLGRLDDEEAGRLIRRVVGGQEVARDAQNLILTKTDGVPLFVEEFTKTLLESGRLVENGGQMELVGLPSQMDLPATLRDSLSARLDRLGPARWVAQVAAVLGRGFTFEQLSQIADMGGDELQRGVDQLVTSELVLRKGFGARRRYVFKHALVQEAAYESLLVSERRRLHGRIAEMLESTAESREQEPERLAHHLTLAGFAERALHWWLAAGELAISRSAHREGVRHLEQGLAVIQNLPAGAARDQQELALHTRLGAAASVMKGYGAPEVERSWGRARELCGTLDDSPELFWVLWGLWSFHLVRAELAAALDLGQRLLRIAESMDDEGLQLVALGALGLGNYFRGDLKAARHHLDRAVALDDPKRHEAIASVTGQDVGVVAWAARALVLWHLGEEEEAVHSSTTAVVLAERVGHSYSLAFARVYAARLHQSRRDVEALEEQVQTVISLSREKGYFWLTQGLFFRGCLEAEKAALADGDALDFAPQQTLASGLDGYCVAGARLSLTYMLTQFAQILSEAGEVDAAEQRLKEGFAQMEESTERFWEPELLRLRGEFFARADQMDRAEEFLQRALELARERGDRAFEVRAGLALGRWLQGQGRKKEAREVVSASIAAHSPEAGGPDLEAARNFL